MNFEETFRQEKLGEMPGAQLIETKRPCGPQWTKSSLVADLVAQLRFSRRVTCIQTNMILQAQREIGGAITVDVFYSTHPDQERKCEHVAVFVNEHEVNRRIDVELEVAFQRWCERRGIDVVTIGTNEIRGPYLENARRLEKLRDYDMDPQGELLAAFDNHLVQGESTVGETVAALITRGIPAEIAEDTVARCIANAWALADLSVPYGPKTRLRKGSGVESMFNRNDSLLAVIMDRKSR